MFNKDLEEIKKSEPVMNNAKTEIKSTLRGTNNRITKSKERISEAEDKMVEINKTEREKKILMRTTLKTSWTVLNAPKFESQVIPKEEDKKKDCEKCVGNNS